MPTERFSTGPNGGTAEAMAFFLGNPSARNTGSSASSPSASWPRWWRPAMPDANSYRNSLDVLRDLVICCDQYDSAKPASVENYRGALADARAFLEKHWDGPGGPSREEVIEQCAEAVNLVRFNEAALHRKALTKAIE